ncbi:MAG: hypothetical protein ACTHMU_03695 [Thermomicrobiales bacterium]
MAADRRARRLAIARRRQRIAEQPRVGDTLWCDPDAIVAQLVVTSVDDELVWTDERDHDGQWWRSSWIRDFTGWPLEWRQLVRRARCTQEATNGD